MNRLPLFCFASLITTYSLFSGCKESKGTEKLSDFTLRSFMLQDSLAEIQMYVPNEMDTFFHWVHYDDNACDDFKKYRFASSLFSPVAETGSFPTPEVDSAYQLTIYHVDEYRCKFDLHPVDSPELVKRMGWLQYLYADKAGNLELVSGEINNYNGRNFMVMCYKALEGYPDKGRSSYVTAYTTIDSIGLGFDYYTDGTNQAGFLERMKKSLSTVKITPHRRDVSRNETEED